MNKSEISEKIFQISGFSFFFFLEFEEVKENLKRIKLKNVSQIIQGVFFKSAALKFLITPSIFNFLSFGNLLWKAH